MDWRTTGLIFKQRNGRYTFQQYCQGCQKIEDNNLGRTERAGNLKHRQDIVYGIVLVILQRGGQYQWSLQSPDNNETYYEVWLKGILACCQKQRRCLDMWDEGTDIREGIVEILAEESLHQSKVVKAKQQANTKSHLGGPVKQDRQVTNIEAQEQFWKLSGLICELFRSRSDLLPHSSRLLVIESLVNQSKYTLERGFNRIMYNFVNKVKEGWRKDFIDELRSLGTNAIKGKKLLMVVEARQKEVGDAVYDSMREYFGRD
ncbi:hypothetical protein BC830DRAFT_1218969 [Chytriomyces sp. MP71]|nr:hypothetical protein BC830DRAFT_1218969 [Chytriomyces sp. MP71]